MGNMKNRVQGKAEELAGAAKKTVGHAVGDREMEANGAALQVKGEVRQEVAKAAERLKGAVESAVGAAQAAVGDATGDDRLHIKGKLTQLKGDARSDVNQ
jgi:uncharacterized protein YjbJ (UPF0337 family)